MKRVTFGIDNGTSGSIAIIGPDGVIFEPMPTKQSLMGKKGKVIKRIDHSRLDDIISVYQGAPMGIEVHAYIERPFTGGAMMINVMTLAARAYESVLIVLEQNGIGHTTVDSKEWQAACIPGVKGSSELKLASRLRGVQQYPKLASTINDHGDADGLFIAKHYHNQ